MRPTSRWMGRLLTVFLLLSLGLARAGAPPAPTSTLKVISYDLQGRKGPLAVTQYDQLKSLVMYLSPDVIAIHNVLKEAGQNQSTPLAQTAQALEMYYAYQPLTDTLGSALLSRYPIRNATCLFDQKTQASMGMQMAIQVGPRSYSVLVVRPPTAAVSRTTTTAVLQQTKALAGTDYLVLASFSPNGGGKQSLAAWTKAGMVDALAKAKLRATFPATKPKERADFILLSPKLRADLVGTAEVIQSPRLLGLSEHLPVQVVVRR